MKWNNDFKLWQNKFYNSKRWRELRDEIRLDRGMRCDSCGRIIRGCSIVDHIEEITPDNKDDNNITLNKDNLQLLCLECHNRKTFRDYIDFDLENRDDVNLF